jgi:hypothetical protein
MYIPEREKSEAILLHLLAHFPRSDLLTPPEGIKPEINAFRTCSASAVLNQAFADFGKK